MEQYPSDDHSERVQRALNSAKRDELKDRFGMCFHRVSEDIPADVEADFLSYVEEYERQWESAGMTTVRDFLDNPDVKLPADLSPDELEAELERLLDLMYERGVRLDFMYDVPTEEAYRFIVEEFFDHEIENIDIDGMMHGFIYEEFHPNLRRDAEVMAEEVINGLFVANMGSVDLHCARTVTVGEIAGVQRGDLYRQLVAPTTDGRVVTSARSEARVTRLDDTYAVVEAHATWEGTNLANGASETGQVVWEFGLSLWGEEYWRVDRITPVS